MSTRGITDIDVLLGELGDVKNFMKEHVDRQTEPLQEELNRLSSAVGTVEEGLKDLRRDKIARMGDDGRFRMAHGRFAGYDILDLRFLESLLKSGAVKGRMDSGEMEMLRDVRVAKSELVSTITPESLLVWEDATIKRRGIMFPNETPEKSASFRESLSGWRSQMVDLVQRAMDSTTSGSGDELVPTFEAAELWMDVNLETLVLPLFQQVVMPTNPFDLPIQLGDVNWYPGSENVQVNTTDVSTGKSTLSAKALRAGVPFSDELEEDAVIAFVPELRRNLVRNAAEVIDDVLLNADQTETNGINADGGTISAATAGKAQFLLGFDGLAHLPLVDNTSQVRNSAGGAVSADEYNRTLALLGKYAIPRRRGDVVYVTDVNTGIRSLAITEFETIDVAGARATLSSGEILNVYGKPLVMSEQLLQADADGKVTSAGNATDTGRILCVNTTQWRVGFRREIELETDREAGKGQTTMYASFRIAFDQRSASRGTATHTAIARNIAA